MIAGTPRHWLWGAAALLVCALLVGGSGYSYAPLVPAEPSGAGGAAPGGETSPVPPLISSQAPRGVYIVIDRTNNRLYLRRGEETLLAAICSAGSGSVLSDPAGERQWIFDTPAGVFRVRSKILNPAWRKPDWAFIEEGEPLPTDNGNRIEYGVLGDYALDLGDGYLIHGTLYERLLGRSVTHGCIRLGRDDLRQVFHAAQPGTPVYVF